MNLLVPTIFRISVKNIESGIEVLKEYGIDEYVTNSCLRKKPEFLRNLIEYLIKNNIDLVTKHKKTSEYILNPILNYSKTKLKEKGIDIELIKRGGFSK